jgi:hypothetical protein
MRVTSGTVMKVVTSAMITIMANVLSDITCYHRVWIQINMIIAQLKLNKRVFEVFNLFGRSFNLLRHHVNLNCCSSPGFECQSKCCFRETSIHTILLDDVRSDIQEM